MSMKPVEQMLIKRRGAQGRRPSGAAKPREIWPAIVLKGKQTTMDELKRKLRVSMDVEAVTRPRVQSQDYGSDLSHIIRQRHAGEAH